MQAPIEIPITIVHHTETGYIQIAPAQQFNRLPAARQLSPELSVEPELRTWQRNPTNRAAQDDLRERLEEVGNRVYTLLDRESLQSILDIQGQKNNSLIWRRILVYTDRNASQIPIETMWSDERPPEGESLGFVVANHAIPISIVRHLGMEPTASLEVESGLPLQMLVVFSNPQQEHRSLGEVIVEDGGLTFEGHLLEEKGALDAQLGALIQLNLLEIQFLVGNESNHNNSVVYQGRVQLRNGQPYWKVEEANTCDLEDTFLVLLSSMNWHILHYFGHGAGNEDPELVLRPGHNLSCEAIGQKITQLPRVVILNACESATPVGTNTPVLTGFATLFLLRGTVNLICMQMRVTPNTATLTTEQLYYRLSKSLFTRQMDFEESLYEVHKLVYNSPPRLDFFCPVLYARPVNGPIFAYQDDRLEVWKAIMEGRLPWSPVRFWSPTRLLKARSWCLRLREQIRTRGLSE